MKISRRTLGGLASFALLTFALAASAQDHKWKSGDIFLSGTNAIGSGTNTVAGQWQVFRPGTGFIDMVNDTNGASITPGPNFGSAIDNTWHLIGTDSGPGSGSSRVVKFRIAPHDTTNPIVNPALTDVVSTFSSANEGSTSSVNPQSILVDGAGNIIVANANPAAIFKFGPSGQTFGAPWPIVPGRRDLDKNGQLAGIDIDQSESTLFYTDGGPTIFAVQLATGAITSLTSFSQTSLFDIRFVPPGWLPTGPTACGGVACPTGPALLVAAQTSVLLIDIASGKLVHTYSITGGSNLQALTLDPMLRDGSTTLLAGFWTTGPTSPNFFHVSFDGTSTSYSAAALGYTGIFSIASYPGFNANQSAPTQLTGPTLTASAGTFQTNDAVYSFGSGSTTDTLTLTGYANPSFALNFQTTPIVFAAAVQPTGGNADDSNRCLQTLSGNLCTVWQVDLPPTAAVPASSTDQALPSNALVALKIIASQGAPQPADADTRMYRNEWDDITDKIDIGGFSRTSLYSLIEVPGLAQTGGQTPAQCIYSPPVNDGYPTTNSGGSLNNPGNVTFRFTCFGLTNDQIASLAPRISVVELGTGGAPLPYFPEFTSLTGGTCCTQANYRLDETTSPFTWVVNVSFKNLPTNDVTFTATTYDAKHVVSAFDITFQVLNAAVNVK